ncbi:hypothetical protein ANCCEY_09677 [Ancylostoma ceylanicum]|uniref:Uncharacterized protein n=1 Tax=Ancylostoma ceylanicum TaxID=53326 RepID=A0A0D6LGW2_9BILA|nr:hypothetical protein ANCCEY_09677 [Ancylostoma ceylanicum]
MGWQMAAIKYEKDRAANTLLPNYNTYGKYDIPSYYESYWQSPEERYYTGLFIIQILCLIAAFFLLFASVALIYGVHTRLRYEREPKARFVEKEDPVAHWVKDQQRIERGEAISEPVSPSREARANVPLQKIFINTVLSGAHHGVDLGAVIIKIQLSQNLRKSNAYPVLDFSHDRRRRRRSKTRYSESEITETTDHERVYREDRERRSRRSHPHDHYQDRDDKRRRKGRSGEEHGRRRHDRDSECSERHRRREVSDADVDRALIRHRERREEQRPGEIPGMERPEKDSSFDMPGEGVFPLSGGISIPQHIVIPPSSGERGPDGLPLPQKFQINSEITINYDGHNSSGFSDQQQPFRRKYPVKRRSSMCVCMREQLTSICTTCPSYSPFTTTWLEQCATFLDQGKRTGLQDNPVDLFS